MNQISLWTDVTTCICSALFELKIKYYYPLLGWGVGINVTGFCILLYLKYFFDLNSNVI